MRKVIFTIDDIEYFKRKHNLTNEQTQDIFGNKESFKVIYTIIGEGKDPDKYTLTDFDGNKININSLNGYQKGIIINDCMAYFMGGTYFNNSDCPCGVVDIREESSDV